VEHGDFAAEDLQNQPQTRFEYGWYCTDTILTRWAKKRNLG